MKRENNAMKFVKIVKIGSLRRATAYNLSIIQVRVSFCLAVQCLELNYYFMLSALLNIYNRRGLKPHNNNYLGRSEYMLPFICDIDVYITIIKHN
jgi:hypothetical protein